MTPIHIPVREKHAITWFKWDHHKGEGYRLEKEVMIQDRLLKRAVKRRRKELAKEMKLPVYSQTNYYASLAMHDNRLMEILQDERAKEDRKKAKSTYHREQVVKKIIN